MCYLLFFLSPTVTKPVDLTKRHIGEMMDLFTVLVRRGVSQGNRPTDTLSHSLSPATATSQAPSGIVTSQHVGFPLAQAINVAPSGRLPLFILKRTSLAILVASSDSMRLVEAMGTAWSQILEWGSMMMMMMIYSFDKRLTDRNPDITH